jgi:phosphopantothenoylcysteine decarboxylase/phosphopantothenate--cysteine ligase
MAEIVLGVTGGIAAYKAVDVLRLLQRSGHSVRVVMTRTAERFVGAPTFAALSGHPVGRSMFPTDDEPGYDHLDLARSADLLLIAPASANTLAKMAAGQADACSSTPRPWPISPRSKLGASSSFRPEPGCWPTVR